MIILRLLHAWGSNPGLGVIAKGPGFYPLAYKTYKNSDINNYQLRPNQSRVFNDIARLKLSKSSFNIDLAKIWNRAPEEVKSATTLISAKKAIKKFSKSLPI